MAVPEQTPYIEHTGNGSSKSFSLGFQCESKDHLIVLIDDIEPPIATWSLSGGNVVFTTAPAAGKKIIVQRNTPFGRATNYQSFNNSFRPQTVNIDFDRIWWKLQELGVGDWLLKLYVDRLHQQQEEKIDDLKDYVDDRDDELRAYLMEEIRKQGVALDQLDEYYNYLMQRLAQIAVDKGWDSSFIVHKGQTQYEINEENIRKNKEFATVQDFYTSRTRAHQGTTTLASALYSSLSQLKSDYPFADSLDWSVDALALQAFFNYLQGTRVVKAVCSGEFFSSKPLELKAELTKTLEFNAVLKPIVGFGGGDLLTIRTSRHLQMTGNLELWGAVSATAGLSWANRLWNNGIYIIDSTRMTNTLKITPRYFKGWGVLAYSSTYDTVSTNNNMTSFGTIQAQLNGSKAGQWQTTFTNRVNTGSASSTGQRSTLTLSTPVDDVSLVDSNIIYNGELYLITDHSGAQITVFPWLSKTNTTGSINIIYGGGVKSSGADSNCVCFDMIDASDNAVGAHVRAFLGSIVNRFVGQFNTIGSQHGNRVINTALYGTWINPYYEGNMFDMYSTSYAPNSDLMLNPNALHLSRCVQLQPRKADLTLDENISRFQNSMYLDGKWVVNQNNRPDGTSATSIILSLGDPKKVIRSNTVTINLKDDADKRRLWGYTDIEFEIIGNAVNNGTSGVSTIKCDAGYTINGSSSDLVVQPSNSAFRILARLVNGSDWSISIFYAEKPSASKTYDPPSLASGAQQSTTVTLTGATLGSLVACSFSLPLSGTRMWAEVTAANTVTVYHRNDTGAPVDLESGTLSVKFT